MSCGQPNLSGVPCPCRQHSQASSAETASSEIMHVHPDPAGKPPAGSLSRRHISRDAAHPAFTVVRAGRHTTRAACWVLRTEGLMRYEATATCLSWIPPTAVEGVFSLPFGLGVAHF